MNKSLLKRYAWLPWMPLVITFMHVPFWTGILIVVVTTIVAMLYHWGQE